VSVCRTVYEIFSVKEWRDLETEGRGRSRALKIAPCGRSYVRLSIGRPLLVWLYVVPFLSYLTLNNRDLEKVTEGLSNWYHSKAWCGFLFAFHSNYGRIFNRL